MIDLGPAFVLGNSPRLPIDDLECLAGCFTVGVNRILQVFTPTVLVWVDGTVSRNDVANRALMDDTDALLVCDKSVADTQGHHGLLTHVGDAAVAHNATPKTLVCNGNTGCCAARWAYSLGCRPVYLVGMDATYVDGKTDFYGVNEHHHRRAKDNGTAAQMRAEVEWLKVNLGDDVVEVFDGVLLRKLAATVEPRNQDMLRHAVLEKINA